MMVSVFLPILKVNGTLECSTCIPQHSTTTIIHTAVQRYLIIDINIQRQLNTRDYRNLSSLATVFIQ